MLNVRKSAARAHLNHGWLDTFHTFSFGSYHDPANMGFRSLRVINEDRVAPGMGFGAHPHRDMEIITYVLSGALEHEDSLGNTAVIRPGEVQKMSAGTGVVHAERNPSAAQSVHLMQIWIVPDKTGIAPAYAQRSFAAELSTQGLILVASPQASDSVIGLQQDAYVYMSRPKNGTSVAFSIRPKRGVWVQVLRGQIAINGAMLAEGDGAGVENESALQIDAAQDAEFILFDLG